MSQVLTQLKRLPAPYKQLAIREYVKHKRTYTEVPYVKSTRIYHAVDMGFIWSETPQGHSFWGTIQV